MFLKKLEEANEIILKTSSNIVPIMIAHKKYSFHFVADLMELLIKRSVTLEKKNQLTEEMHLLSNPKKKEEERTPDRRYTKARTFTNFNKTKPPTENQEPSSSSS